MLKSRINGVLAGASFVALLAGCSSPKEPFRNRLERPSEQCLPAGVDGGQDARKAVRRAVRKAMPDTGKAFGDRRVLRHVVRKGDTLWGIAGHFLAQPWYWKQLWYDNPQIRNPHFIYPGDVLSVVTLNGEKRITITEANPHHHGNETGRRTADGLRIYKYRPHVAAYPLNDAPISIAAASVAPFLLKTQIFTPAQVMGLPFIFGDAGDYLTLTDQETVYAKDLPSDVAAFDVYRVGTPFSDPNVGENGAHKRSGKGTVAGYEMRYIAKVEVTGRNEEGLAELHPVDVVEPIHERDVLVPTQTAAAEQADYFPRLPGSRCQRGYMLGNTNPQTLSIKEFDTVVTSFGKDNGAEVGDVWKIVRPGALRNLDGASVKLPPKELGYLMIIRVYDQYSLGFVLDSTQNIDVNDWLVRP